MGIGIALGGVAKGIESAERTALDRQELGIRKSAVDAQNRATDRLSRNDLLAEADAFITQGLGNVVKIVEAGKAAGDPPEKIAASVEDVMAYVDRISLGVGRDPGFYRKQVNSLITGTPTGAETAAATGTTSAQEKIAERDALVAQGVPQADADVAAGISRPVSVFDRALLNSFGGTSPAGPKSYANEGELQAAFARGEVKTGDSVIVGGVRGSVGP